MATTLSPTRRTEESPNSAGVRPVAGAYSTAQERVVRTTQHDYIRATLDDRLYDLSHKSLGCRLLLLIALNSLHETLTNGLNNLHALSIAGYGR